MRWKTPFICSRSPMERLNEQLNGSLKEANGVREQCQRKDDECKAALSKQLQEAEERFKEEISEKEEECKTLISDKRFLESLVLQSNGEIQVICAELEAAYKNWKWEKDELSSQIVAARQETEEITKRSQMVEQAWDIDKEKLLFSLAAYEKKIEEMSMENERVLVQSRAEKIGLESRLNKSEARTQELLEDKDLCVSEKEKMDSNVAELQRKLDLMASEKELMSQKNRELSTEVESLKTQLTENNARLTHLEDEREKNERALHQSREEKIDLQFELNECKERIQDFLRKNEQDMHLWNEEKRNLEFNLAELQTKFELMASERKSMIKIIIELCSEVEFLKTLENGYNATPVCMEDGRLVLKTESLSDKKLLRWLLTKVATIETDINNFRKHVKEGEKQHSSLIVQYKETENSLQQDEIEREMDDMRQLLQTQNQRFEELNIVLDSLSKILESRNSEPKVDWARK